MPDDSEQPFLVLGNGRTGSSWLITSLDRLPDVKSRYEIKWKDPTLDLSAAALLYVDQHASMAAAIKRSSSRAVWGGSANFDPDSNVQSRGSKLILNPYHFYGLRAFANMAKIIEPNIRLILLKRNYLETWLSWKARGVYHELDDTVGYINPAADPARSAAKRPQKPPTIDLVLEHNGAPLSEFAGRPYPLVTAIDDLLQFFSNDIQFLSLVRSRNGIVVDYADIASELGRVAEFIGVPATPEIIADIVGKPRTLKLDRLEDSLHPISTLQTIAEAMDRTFKAAASNYVDPDLIWKWISEDTAAIGAPLVTQAIAPYGFPVTNNVINWKIQRPAVLE